VKAQDRFLRSNRQRYQIFRAQNGLCGECSKQLGDDFEIDHRISKKRDGPTAYWNLQAVHPRCNRTKGAS
jgi:5-methylcytosine-specific restriction endonuclease McrA